MSIHSVSNRPQPSFNTLSNTQTATPASAVTSPVESPVESSKRLALKPSDTFAPGVAPRLLSPELRDLNPALQNLSPPLQDLKPQIPDLMDLRGPGTRPVSPQQQVQNIAREAMGERLDTLSQELGERVPQRNKPEPLMAMVRPLFDDHRLDKLGSLNEKRLNNMMGDALQEARGLLEQGGAQNLVRADKLLDAVDNTLHANSPKAEARASQQLERLVGKDSRLPKPLEMGPAPKPGFGGPFEGGHGPVVHDKPVRLDLGQQDLDVPTLG